MAAGDAEPALRAHLGEVEYRVLGPVTVSVEGRPLKLGGPRQRMVLAVLLSRVNHTVSQDALIEAVWSGEPPEAAKATLQGYIYGLRRELGSDSIVRHGDGYRGRCGGGVVRRPRVRAHCRPGTTDIAR